MPNLYVRQLAYYRTTPEKTSTPRYEIYQRGSGIEFPPIEHGAYILQYLEELGYCKSGFNGLVPLDFTEINAYIQSTSTEYYLLKCYYFVNSQNAYVSQSYDKDVNAVPPYATVKKVGMSADAVKNAFAGICKVESK